MPVGVVAAGRLDEARDERGLGQVEVARVLAEVMSGGRAHPDDRGRAPLRQVDLIQVALQNLVLAVEGLETERRQRLPQLARQGPLAAGVEVLGELLGDRAATLHDLAALHVGEQGARERARIDTGMPVEAAVLHRDDRVQQLLRQVVDRDGEPLFPHVARQGAERLGLDRGALQILPGREVLDPPDAAEPDFHAHERRFDLPGGIVEGVQVDLEGPEADGVFPGHARMVVDPAIPESRQPFLEIFAGDRQAAGEDEGGREDPRRSSGLHVGEAPVGVDAGESQEAGEDQGDRQPGPEKEADRVEPPPCARFHPGRGHRGLFGLLSARRYGQLGYHVAPAGKSCRPFD